MGDLLVHLALAHMCSIAESRVGRRRYIDFHLALALSDQTNNNRCACVLQVGHLGELSCRLRRHRQAPGAVSFVPSTTIPSNREFADDQCLTTCGASLDRFRLREERVDERGHSVEPKPRDMSSRNGECDVNRENWENWAPLGKQTNYDVSNESAPLPLPFAWHRLTERSQSRAQPVQIWWPRSGQHRRPERPQRRRPLASAVAHPRRGGARSQRRQCVGGGRARGEGRWYVLCY